MRQLILSILTLCAAVNLLAQTPEGYTAISVEARPWQKGQKDLAWKQYDTRIVANINGFKSAKSLKTNEFGSDITASKLLATGFFHAQKIDGRWWLVDPEGYRHISVAIGGFRQGGSERNLERFNAKFGTAERWVQKSAKMFRDLGFSGTGSWSAETTIGAYNATSKEPLTHTPILNFMSTYGRQRGGTYQLAGNIGYPNQCIFVFEPQFEQFCDSHAQQVALLKDDKSLMGYFSDNELPLTMRNLESFLSLPNPEDPGRIAAQQWLAERGIAPEQITDEHRAEFAGVVADRYYSIVSKALKKYDPNHMYLGSRLHGGSKFVRQIVEAAGRYCDVVSINYYGDWTPSAKAMQNWGVWAQKPFMITEFYTKAMDSGLANTTGAGFTVHTQQDRGNAYQHFTLALLESGNCVGWHWFKYQDNDPTAKGVDPSNVDSNKGLVDNCYTIYTPLSAMMRQLNLNVYRLAEYFDKKR